MSLPGIWPQVPDFFGAPLVIEPSPGQLSGDAGLLPIRHLDEHIGLTQSFAEALEDPRDPDLTEHAFLEMVRSRVYGILAGYEDQNDHDTLRADPVFKLVAGRSPNDGDLASHLRPEHQRGPARETEGLLAEAAAAHERERQAARRQDQPRPPAPARLFTGFWYQAGTWLQPRWVVAKAEANDQGANRRFVVTNRPGAVLAPGPAYDE
jgi:hypothetical protein